MYLELKERLCSKFTNHCIHDIVCSFINGSDLFVNPAYDEPYTLLDKCWDNKSGEDEHNTLLCYFVNIQNNEEIELKLYFSEQERYLDAIEFWQAPILADFKNELSFADIKVCVDKVEEVDWKFGEIIIDNSRIIIFQVYGVQDRYKIFQIQNPYVAEKQEALILDDIKARNIRFNEINFQELQTSRFW